MLESRRQLILKRMVDYGHQYFDPEAGLLKMPMDGYRNVHTEHLDDTPRHVTRESLYYALALLEMADHSMLEHAMIVLERVIEIQEISDPFAPTYGMWPYFLEDPVPCWSWPDFNWADFNAMALLVIWHRHRSRILPGLLDKMVHAIRRASVCIRRRNVDLNYTNIAILGTFVGLSAAEVTGDDDLLHYSLDRLKRLRDTVAAAGAFSEYNSPTYSGVSLSGLHAIDNYVRHSQARKLVRPLIERLWSDVAERFHPGFRELAGPHARAYTLSFNQRAGLLGVQIEQATQGALSFEPRGEPFSPLYGCVMSIEAPEKAVKLLKKPVRRRRYAIAQTQTSTAEAPRTLRTLLDPDFCLGCVSFQDGWEQRNNLIAHWAGLGPQNGILHHRYLHDDRPCCSGYLATEQKRGAIKAAAFLGSFADHHGSVPVDSMTAAFLGAVLDLDSGGESLDVRVDGARLAVGTNVKLQIGSIVRVEVAKLRIEWQLISHEVSPFLPPPPRIEHQETGRLQIILPHYEGPKKKMRWLDFQKAASVYLLRIAGVGKALPSSSFPAPKIPPIVLNRRELELWMTEHSTTAIN